MCTVSILRHKSGMTVTSNRDELRTRNEAGVKQELAGSTQRIYPVDAQAQGTWVGVNDYGIAASLLNMYESEYQGSLSRGLIIPRLLEFQSLDDARDWLTQSLQPYLYSAFVLLVMDRNDLYRYRWDGNSLTEELIEFSHYFLETSSSVDLVETVAHRQRIFKEWHDAEGHCEAVLTFHCKRDETSSTNSICMAREHSHTKSVSQIQIDDNTVYFRYLSPDCLEQFVNTQIDATQLEVVEYELLDSLQSNTAVLPKVCAG